MSLFGSSRISEQPKLLGLDAAKANTNEKGIVLPWFCGTARLGIHWIGRCYNRRTKAVKSGGGKGGGQTTGYDYYADVAGLFCHGPVDFLYDIILDGRKVWYGSLERSGDSATVDLDGDYGTATIYWGTATQPADSRLTAVDDHPPYRGQCYIFFRRLKFGRNKTQAPTIEVTLARKARQVWGNDVYPALPYGFQFYELSNFGANAAWVLADFLTDKVAGAGLDYTDLNFLSFHKAAYNLSFSADGYISPVLTSPTSSRAFIDEILGYIDGFVYRPNSNGVDDPVESNEYAGYFGFAEYWGQNSLSLGLVRSRLYSGGFGQPGLIGEKDLMGAPSLKVEAWSETVNEMVVSYRVGYDDFGTDSVTVRNEAAFFATGGAVRRQVDRQWLLSGDAAAAYGAAFLGAQAFPKIDVSIEISSAWRREDGRRLIVGSFVELQYAPLGRGLLFRVTSIEQSDSRDLTLKVRGVAERYLEAVGHQVVSDPAISESDESPGDVYAPVAVELTPDLIPSQSVDGVYLALLAGRTTFNEDSFVAYASENGGSYRGIFSSGAGIFAVAGTLESAYAATSLLDRSTTGLLVKLATADVDAPQADSDTDWLRGKCLAFINAGAEILAYATATVVGNNQLRLTDIRRGFGGSSIQSHASGTSVHIIAFDDLFSLTAKSWTAGDALQFALPSAALGVEQPLAEAQTVSITLADKSHQPPAPLNASVNGCVANCGYTTGGAITLEWDGTVWSPAGTSAWWSLWDSPAVDSGGSAVQVGLWSLTGTTFTERKAVYNYSSVVTATIANTALRQAFSGSTTGAEPLTFGVEFQRKIGSLLGPAVRLIVTRGLTGTTVNTWSVLGTADPAKWVDLTLARIATRWSISLPALRVSTTSSVNAASLLQSRFNAIASATGLTFPTLATSAAPDIDVQLSFDKIAAIW